MKNRSITYLLLFGICSMLAIMQSCQKTDDLEADINSLKDRVTALEKATEGLNTSFSSLQTLMQENKVIIGITPTKDGNGFLLELSDGTTITVMNSESIAAAVPTFSVDNEGYWIYKTASESEFHYLPGPNGEEKVSAIPRTESGSPIITPKVNVSSTGYWQVSYDNGKTYTNLKDENGDDIKAEGGQGGTSIFSKVTYDEINKTFSFTLAGTEAIPGKTYTFSVDDSFDLIIEGMDMEQTQVFALDEKRKEYNVIQKDVAEVIIQAPDEWQVNLTETTLTIIPPLTTGKDIETTIKIVATSSKNYIRIIPIKIKVLATEDGTTLAWNEFKKKVETNALVDFSYAGYKQGTIAPPEMNELIAKGYKVYDITQYGAIPNDGKSDRAAFMKVLSEAIGAKQTEEINQQGLKAIRFNKTTANAIVYFPEGHYILQGEGDENITLRLTMGNIVLKGAGRDKTTIEMASGNSTNANLWNTPVMLEFKHNSGLGNFNGDVATTITEDAEIGEKTVRVSSTLGISPGSWVCLNLINKDSEVINTELSPYSSSQINTQGGVTPNIVSEGIQIYEYHQVASTSGGSVTFTEPIMHPVKASWNWKLLNYPHYENIGVEDLTFKGNAKEKFIHHGSDADDGGYKLVDFIRLTNSWMRRVNFESVSEASSIVNSANCSVYDIQINGNRGHAAIRSQASSRIFIGKVVDQSEGYALIGESQLGSYMKNAGQYHACGVSKQSIGAVIWNVKWGDDSCFESHATQPRATLIDCCTGAFMPWRQGGDSPQMPNHMEKLTIWNFNATKVTYDTGKNKFGWWDSASYWWKFLPPTIVGFHGQSINFDETQMERNENPNTIVEPYSLYEAQLRLRLGYVPAWLNSLK